jgi:hypothetical protein
MPGHEKTVSTTTAPPSRIPSVVPAVVEHGVIAFLSACRTMMSPRRQPFDRARRM